jgi:hypothetical protein
MNLNRPRKTAVILFFGVLGFYLSLSPNTSQGYVPEEINSGLRMLSVATAVMKGHPVPPMVWSRHGPIPVLLDLPFLRLGKLIVSPDFMLSFSPILFTAGLLTILFLWLRKLCSPAMSLFLTLTAAFGTMLWPYAYISLETKQSFFIFLSGYLVFAVDETRTWSRQFLFAVMCALAISVKGTGIILTPVIAYLFYLKFRGDWRSRSAQLLVSFLTVGAIWYVGHLGINFYWVPLGGSVGNIRPWLVDSPLQPFINIFGVLGSPNKGLLVYCPIIIASICVLPCAFRVNREIVVFVLLVTISTLGFLTLLKYQGDETWGCRYMHLTIAPLILCIGLAWPTFNWRWRGSFLLSLALIGVAISFLGAFYYYGDVDVAMKDAGQNTMQSIEGDPDWNPILFDARLFRAWLTGERAPPLLWTPKPIWVWVPPQDAPSPKSINLRDYCEPQSFMVRFWNIPKNGTVLRIFVVYVCALTVGTLLLFLAITVTFKGSRAETGPDSSSE